MAFMNQDRKAVIAAELKKVMPKDWKYTLRVQHHSTIIMTIQSAPVDLHGLCKYENKSRGYIQLNEFYLERAYDDPKVLEVLLAAKAALNTGNWDKSDIQTDYFNVGWYVSMHIGGFGKPFVVRGIATTEVPAVVEPVVVPEAPQQTPEVEPAEQSLTADELLTAARSIWVDACMYDGIDPDSKFVVFGEKNPFVEFHSVAMSRYFEALAR